MSPAVCTHPRFRTDLPVIYNNYAVFNINTPSTYLPCLRTQQFKRSIYSSCPQNETGLLWSELVLCFKTSIAYIFLGLAFVILEGTLNY